MVSPLSPDKPLLPNEADSEVEIHRHGNHLRYISSDKEYIFIEIEMISPVCTPEEQEYVRR